MDRPYTEAKPPANRPRIFVALEPLEVRLIASDFWAQQRLEPLAALVEAVLAEAVRRPTGSA